MFLSNLYEVLLCYNLYEVLLCYFFAKHSLDSISLEIVNRHALSYVLVQVTVNAPLVQVKLVRVRDNLQTWTRTCTRVYVNVIIQYNILLLQSQTDRCESDIHNDM